MLNPMTQLQARLSPISPVLVIAWRQNSSETHFATTRSSVRLGQAVGVSLPSTCSKGITLLAGASPVSLRRWCDALDLELLYRATLATGHLTVLTFF